MILCKQYHIKPNSPHYKELDDLTFRVKNIYNSTLYAWRQYLFDEEKFQNKKENYLKLKTSDCYRDIPQNVAAATFNLVHQNISSYFAALRAYKKDPSKFTGRPKMPKYKDPKSGRCVAIFNTRVLPKRKARKDGCIRFTGLDFKIKSEIPVDLINHVRFVPRDKYIVVEVVYEKEVDTQKENGNHAAIDLGVNNLATITSNVAQPKIISGRPAKSINQFFNKQKAKIQSTLERRNKKKWSKKLSRMQKKRNMKLKDYMHKASKKVVEYCKENKVTVLTIGKNNGWKTSAHLGKKNNQNFVQIPFNQFIQMIEYKAQLAGISCRLVEEAYTSKCSFIDDEEIGFHRTYKGDRIKRGLFKSSDGTTINADVNGSFNILKKAIPELSHKKVRDRGLMVSPTVIKL